MIYTKAYITTEDQDFSQELTSVNIPDVVVLTRFTGAIQWDQTIQHVVEFASERAVDLFCVWLATKMIKKKPHKSTINRRKIPTEPKKIARIIKNVESQIENEKDAPEED